MEAVNLRTTISPNTIAPPFLYDFLGLYGVFITIFLYTFTCLLGAILVYIYFLRLHNNGRLMDVYHRLTGDEGDFFLPFDLELSLQELSYICR